MENYFLTFHEHIYQCVNKASKMSNLILINIKCVDITYSNQFIQMLYETVVRICMCNFFPPIISI